MKRVFTFALAIMCFAQTQAQLTVTETRQQTIGQDQVGIGTTMPDASAKLDITSTTRGLLIPRMTNAQMSAISSPANGLQVYNTDSSALFFYNGSAWTKIGSGGGSSFAGLPVFNVALYGAVADSSTDNTTAFQAAINAAYAGSSSTSKTVYIGPGRWKVSGTLHVPAGVIIQGAGAGRFTYGYGPSNTLVFMPAGNDTLFEVNGQAVKFRDIGMKCTASEATAGAGIYTTNGIGFSIDQSYVEGFYDNIYLNNCYSFTVQNTSICGMWRHGLILEDDNIPDEGDGVIMGNWFNPRHHNCETAIRQSSGGGVKIGFNKFNNAKPVTGIPDEGGPYYFDYCYQGIFYTDVTSDILMGTNSFENYAKAAIYVDPNGNFHGHMPVTGNQFASYHADTRDIVFKAFPTSPAYAGGVAIVGNTFLAFNTGQTVIGTPYGPFNENDDTLQLTIRSGYSFLGNTINGAYTDRPLNVGGSIIGNYNYLVTQQFFARNNGTAGNATMFDMGVNPGVNNAAEWRFIYNGNNSTANQVDFGFTGVGGGPLKVKADGSVIVTTADYANNAAAVSAGKAVGTLYWNTTTLQLSIVR